MAQRILAPFFGNRQLARGREEVDPMIAFRRDVNRLLDDFVGGLGFPMLAGELPRQIQSGMAAPRIDVSETDKDLRIVAEMPGLDQANIDVSLDDDVLTIRGQRQEERADEDTERDYHLRERLQSSFARSLALPFRPDPRQVQAVFKDGVLTVTIPKPKEAQERVHRIEVKRDEGTAGRGVEAMPFDRAAAGDKPSASAAESSDAASNQPAEQTAEKQPE